MKYKGMAIFKIQVFHCFLPGMSPSFDTPSEMYPALHPPPVFYRKGRGNMCAEPIPGIDPQAVQIVDRDSEQCQGP